MTDPVADLIAGVPHPGRRDDALRLEALFRDVTGWQPRLWRETIIGFGAYEYRYQSGRSGTWLATGFAPRKAHMVLYILPGYADFGPILDRLGPHRRGKSCLYLGRLSGLDEGALRDLIAAGLEDLSRHWPISPS